VTRFGELLKTLATAGVDFILIGGVAAAAHGSPRATQDIDVLYRRTPDNLMKLVAAVAPLNPALRGAPPGLPFRFDVATVKAGLNFTLTTSLGQLDLLGEITGGGGGRRSIPHTILIEPFGVACRVLDLETLIRAKRAVGRPKDFEAIAELELLRGRQ
jgi:hypothetical protein